MPTASASTKHDAGEGGGGIGGTTLKPPAISTSRPSDFITSPSSSKRLTSAHVTNSGPPTMRVKDVNPAPGSKTRSRLQLMREFTRAPTCEFTSSSLHPSDSHKGAAEANRLAVEEERAMAEMIRQQQQQQQFQQEQEGGINIAHQHFDPTSVFAAGNDENNKSALTARAVQNLREQRDLLQSEVDRLKSGNNNTNNGCGGGMPNEYGVNNANAATSNFLQSVQPLGVVADCQPANPFGGGAGGGGVPATTFLYGIPSSTTAYTPQAPPQPHLVPLVGNGTAAILSPLNVNTAAPGSGGMVPKDSVVRAAKREAAAAAASSSMYGDTIGTAPPTMMSNTNPFFLPDGSHYQNAALMNANNNGPTITPLGMNINNTNNAMVEMPMGLQPPTHAPYGAFCCAGTGLAASSSSASNVLARHAREKEDYSGTGVFDHLNGLGKFNKLRSSSKGKKSSPSSSSSVKQYNTKLHEQLDAERQNAVAQLEEAEVKIVQLENQIRDMQTELLETRQRAAMDRERAEALDSQVSGAVAGHQRAEALRARAASAMETMNQRNAALEKEVDFLRSELSQARTYMVRFGGIGKDFSNAVGGGGGHQQNSDLNVSFANGQQQSLSAADAATKEFYEANNYFNAANTKMAKGEAGSEDEINAMVNYVLSGGNSNTNAGGIIGNAGSSSNNNRNNGGSLAMPSDAHMLQEAHREDPNRLFMTEKDPFGAGKLGQIALLNSMKNAMADLKHSLTQRDETIAGLNETIVRLSQEVARATNEARLSDERFSVLHHHHEADKVLLADAQGEVEYLRLLTGEQTETIGRMGDENHKLNVQVRHELDVRMALESQRDALSDDVARLSEENAHLMHRIESDLGGQIALLEQTVTSLTDDHNAKSAALEEMQRKHDIVNARKIELEEIIEKQLTALDGTLQTMLSYNSEVARGEESRLRDALALLNDIRRGTAVANATEVVSISVPHNNSQYQQQQQQQHTVNGLPPNQLAVLHQPYPMMMVPPPASAPFAVPTTTAGNGVLTASDQQQQLQQLLLLQQMQHQQQQMQMASGGAMLNAANPSLAFSLQQMQQQQQQSQSSALAQQQRYIRAQQQALAQRDFNGGGEGGGGGVIPIQPLGITTTSSRPQSRLNSPTRSFSQFAANQQQQQQLVVGSSSGNVGGGVFPASSDLSPNNQFLQQIRADKQSMMMNNNATNANAFRLASTAPFASVGALHERDPLFMDTAASSARLIREAYANSRNAAQFALARYEAEAAATQQQQQAREKWWEKEEGEEERARASATSFNHPLLANHNNALNGYVYGNPALHGAAVMMMNANAAADENEEREARIAQLLQKAAEQDAFVKASLAMEASREGGSGDKSGSGVSASTATQNIRASSDAHEGREGGGGRESGSELHDNKSNTNDSNPINAASSVTTSAAAAATTTTTAEKSGTTVASGATVVGSNANALPAADVVVHQPPPITSSVAAATNATAAAAMSHRTNLGAMAAFRVAALAAGLVGAGGDLGGGGNTAGVVNTVTAAVLTASPTTAQPLSSSSPALPTAAAATLPLGNTTAASSTAAAPLQQPSPLPTTTSVGVTDKPSPPPVVGALPSSSSSSSAAVLAAAAALAEQQPPAPPEKVSTTMATPPPPDPRQEQQQQQKGPQQQPTAPPTATVLPAKTQMLKVIRPPL